MWVLYRTIRPWPLSPAWLLLLGYLALALVGRYALRFCSGPLNSLFKLPDTPLDDTLAYFLYVCVASGVGMAAWLLVGQPEVLPVRAVEKLERPEPGFFWVVGMLLPLAIYVIGCGPAMFYRTGYSGIAFRGLKIAGYTLTPFGVAFA